MRPRQKDSCRRSIGAGLHGANLARLRARENPCRPDPQHRAPAEKKGALATTDVPSVARAPRGSEPRDQREQGTHPEGRAEWRARQHTGRRSPTRAARP